MTTPIEEMRARRAHYMDNYGQGDNWQVEGARLHHEYYTWLADFVGATVADLPVSLDRLRESTDRHFNDIPLKLWDERHGAMRYLAKRAGVEAGWSLMETTCALKALARRAIGGEP